MPAARVIGFDRRASRSLSRHRLRERDYPLDHKAYRHRYVIERLFSGLKHWAVSQHPAIGNLYEFIN